ncbi:exonuclease subunit SbcC [Staphylococcus epidermidis]|uniref:exonuclease subunit SbcC n=1 Tax=Staphylococcus epidermidis TaxID=1282 RepID=UPI00070E2429|nr:exonuclease subunit SbcC [Staphylococcus epidermidis]
MKPLHIVMENFGPFIKETIDFEQVETDQLFLISGKTGSGKTMIFDAIVYALYGMASTKTRKEGDLRSHFADGKSPMSVIYQFKVNNQTFKIHREAPFIKEGNITKTQAKLNIYELVDNQFELRESKVNQGNQFIVQLLGVNAEQFRQLFILPQGEFKKFLQSNSKDKQSILRTLFNSERFDEIRHLLVENVKQEKVQIENRYTQIENLWNDIDTFNNDELALYKELESSQTDKMIEKFPQFNDYGYKILKSFEDAKIKITKELDDLNHKYKVNVELSENTKKLKAETIKFDELKKEQNYIDKLNQELKMIQESKVLITYFTRLQSLKKGKDELESLHEQSKLNEKNYCNEIKDFQKQLEHLSTRENEITQFNQYLEKNQVFFNQLDMIISSYQQKPVIEEEIKRLYSEYNDLITKKEKLTKELNDKNKDFAIIEHYTEEIYNLKKIIDEYERQKKDEKLFDKLQQDKSSYLSKLNEKKEQLNEIESSIINIDATLIDLNDKKDFVNEIKSALSVGDTCPICGNEIHSLGEHIDFELIAQKNNKIKQFESKKVKIRDEIIKIETRIEELNHREKELNFEKQEQKDISELQKQLNHLKQLKDEQQSINKLVENFEKQEKEIVNKIHQFDLDLSRKNTQKEKLEIQINDFERHSQFSSVKDFEAYYSHAKKQVENYEYDKEKTKNKLNELNNKLKIEMNDQKHLTENLTQTSKEINNLELKMEKEMQQLGFESYDQVKSAADLSAQKDEIEREISIYNKNYQSFEIEINRLNELVKGKKLLNLEDLRQSIEKTNLKLDETNSQIATISYKIDNNSNKFNNIKNIIQILDDELKVQKEIFLLSEILAGKNDYKLTLENYVLIYYLEKIIFQANQRLSFMSGNRYQLIRREAISLGLSGLEIDVFDFHSNKSRHISSLSGGETFQASLALALGLSEVVQQESGGITLDSMFIDEGFGTLDQETLETAIDTLINLKSSGRMVGIISHVSELKQRIPLILEVTSNQYESHTQFRKN